MPSAGPVPAPPDTANLLQLGGIIDQLAITLTPLKDHLLADTQGAVDKLHAVILELGAGYDTAQQDLKNLLRLRFAATTPSALTDQQVDILVELTGGDVLRRVHRLRGHCSQISYIYHRDLAPWFQRALANDPGPVNALGNVFAALDDADGDMLHSFEELAGWYTSLAAEVLELVKQGRPDEANDLIAAIETASRPLRQNMSEALGRLEELEITFQEALNRQPTNPGP